MNGPNKILTVSYGTFSCTLEGFEENSFETMKAIAEYFRDLAADDRYFGAEPPRPDAEILARLAEQKTAARVQALSDERGVVLRPAEDAEAAPESAALSDAPAAETPAAHTAEMATPMAAALDDDSIAEKLRRIRAVVEQREAENLQEDPVDISNAFAEEAEEMAAGATDSPTTDAAESASAVSQPEPAAIADAPEAVVAQAPEVEEYALLAASGNDDDQSGQAVEGALEDTAEAEEAEPQPEAAEGAAQEIEDTLADVAAEPQSEASDVTPEKEDFIPRVRARIVRMRRGADAATQPPPQENAAILADLPEEASITPRRPRRQSAPVESADLGRLLLRAESALDTPEASARRNALAHLKAAVAATEAARQMGDEAPADLSGNAEFQADLASAITQKPPLSPLKLVAAQRIDAPLPDALPVIEDAPAAQENKAVEAIPRIDQFRAFASIEGVADDADILAAAALFLTEKEGFAKFKQQAMMGLLREYAPEDFDRREGIAALRALVDQNRLTFIPPRHFSTNETTRLASSRQTA